MTMEEQAMKDILHMVVLCMLLLMVCFEEAFAETGDSFYRIFSCESGTVIAAEVSEAYGYVTAGIHAQYKLNRLSASSGEVLVKEIEINGEPYAFEEADADRYESGSRVDYSYRITGFSGKTMDAVSLVIAENLADGEKTYRIDLTSGKMEWKYASAIVNASTDGCIYDAPSSSGTVIGRVQDGTKLTAYFTTEDGWAAVGIGSREVELWGYMRMQALAFKEEEIYGLTSDIEQLAVKSPCSIYGDAACARALYEIRAGDYVSILGYAGDVSFIQTGSRYGYVPTALLRSHSEKTSTAASFIYRADIRNALLTIRVSRDNGLMTAELEYTPQYTVNDDIKSLAVYVNDNHRYVLSEENGFSMELPKMGGIASLVVVPVWASGGEIVEDSVIVAVPDSGVFK